MVESQAVTQDIPVNSKSNAPLYDAQDEPPDLNQHVQQSDPAEQVEGHEVEEETTVGDIVIPEEQDDEYSPINEAFWSNPTVLTDAGSGMQVDSAVSWGYTII